MNRNKLQSLMYHYLTTEPEAIKSGCDCRLEINDLIDGIIDCAKAEIKDEFLLENFGKWSKKCMHYKETLVPHPTKFNQPRKDPTCGHPGSNFGDPCLNPAFCPLKKGWEAQL